MATENIETTRRRNTTVCYSMQTLLTEMWQYMKEKGVI